MEGYINGGMPGGIEGELTDANVNFSGMGIHNVLMGCSSGWGGWEGGFALIYKVRNVLFHGKVKFFEFKLEGFMHFFIYLSGLGKTCFVSFNE